MRAWIYGFLCLGLGACQTTKPGDAADLTYRLPKTDAQATLSLTLKSCSDFQAEASLKIVPKAGAQDGAHVLKGADLASVRIKRGLKVTLNDKGVITGVNSSVSDRTPQIIGSYIAGAAKLVGLVSGTKMSLRGGCDASIEAALKRKAAIETQIIKLRQDLNTSAGSNPTPTDADRVRTRDIARLSKELGELSPLLTADLTGAIALTPENVIGAKGKVPTTEKPNTSERAATPVPHRLVFEDYGPVKKWFGTDEATILDSFLGVDWTAEVKPLDPTLVKSDAKPKSLRECAFLMPLPKAQRVHIHLVGAGSMLVDPKPVEADGTVAAAQLGDPAQLCLDASFGETRSLELAFDDYGQVTSYNWNSEATGEAISTMVSGASGDVATIAGAFKGKSDLDRQKAEIDELETAQKLAKLRACKAIMDAGGTCPS